MTTIFDGWIYDHDQYKSIFNTLVEEIKRVLDGGTPIVFPLLGDSRAGKTALLKDIEAHFSDSVSHSGHCQVLFIPMPSAASNEALAVRIIKTVIGNISVKGKTYQILEQAREIMHAAGIQVLLVDETNHLVEKRSTEKAQTKENRQTADWFKELCDLSSISLVVTGLSHVSRIYSDNEQLQNRGLVGARIYPYAWKVEIERKQYQNTILAGIAHLQDHGWTIDVSHDLLTRVTYLGGGGYIGKARDFLVRIEEMGDQQQKQINVILLARAYKDKYILDNYGDPLQLASIDDVMLNGAHQKALTRALSSGRGR